MNIEVSEAEVKLVKDSWAEVVTNYDRAGAFFYQKLFEKAPDLKPLFQENSENQNKKLVFAITLIITKLNKLDNFKHEIKYLSKRHANYGVRPEYFGAFGEAFLAMLKEILEIKWTPEMRLAWNKIYDIIAKAMIEHIQEARNV